MQLSKLTNWNHCLDLVMSAFKFFPVSGVSYLEYQAWIINNSIIIGIVLVLALDHAQIVNDPCQVGHTDPEKF